VNLSGKKILGATIFYSLGEIIPRILAFLLLPVLTKYLSTSEYGINSYIAAVMSFLFVVATLSLNTYVLRNYFLVNDDIERRRLLGGIFVFISTFNALLIIIEIAIIPAALRVFHVDIPFYPFFFLALINNFFDVVSIIPQVIYRVRGDAKRFFYLSVSRIALQYLLIYLLISVGQMGLLGTYYARLIVNIPYAVIYIVIVYRYGKFELNLSRVRDALRFSLPLLPGGLSYLVITISDRVILERFVTLGDIGIYSVAFTLALALNVIVQALYKTFEPILFKEYMSPHFEDLNLRVYRYYMLMVFIGGFAISIFSREVFLVATSEAYRTGYKVVPVMVVSVIIAGINVYLSTLLVAQKKQKVLSLAIVISAVISICLNFLLIPIMGYTGAAVAAICAGLTANIIEHSFAKVRNKMVVPQVLLIAITCVSPYLFDAGLHGLGLMSSIALKTLALMLFSGLAFYVLGCDYKNDIGFLRTNVGEFK